MAQFQLDPAPTASGVTVHILYFARLREILGLGEETLTVAVGSSVASLLAALAARGEVWEAELGGQRLVRAAINQELAAREAILPDGAELALFPPVTGG
ncbi:MoaD/ThiS family protein [Paludibacterium yongneupense]|uniref:MoaD/ThiS family protein n=1 Tax=Paludibacterium yongneupense TaxID=400061 RepID=UPI0004191C69|nr:MoaD/ThiS family protein [Paludibacterium yongneupense]